jgi:hypothetical protein
MHRVKLCEHWLKKSGGFTCVIRIVPNALLTDQPLLGAGPPSLTTVDATYGRHSSPTPSGVGVTWRTVTLND